jgi:hypothetical protein
MNFVKKKFSLLDEDLNSFLKRLSKLKFQLNSSRCLSVKKQNVAENLRLFRPYNAKHQQKNRKND